MANHHKGSWAYIKTGRLTARAFTLDKCHYRDGPFLFLLTWEIQKNSTPSLSAEPSSPRRGGTICCRDLLAAITSWCAPSSDASVKAYCTGTRSRRLVTVILTVTQQKLHSKFCFLMTIADFLKSFFFIFFLISMAKIGISPWALVKILPFCFEQTVFTHWNAHLFLIGLSIQKLSVDAINEHSEHYKPSTWRVG